jgi:von Willebrand factor type A domain-containing protein
VIRACRLVGASFLAVATGCVGLRLTPIEATQQRPSNVAVYFKAQTGSGDPVAGLTAESFRIYEDGQLVSRYESKQTILNPDAAAVHYTMLLVDMSGSMSESGNGEVIPQAVSAFTIRVEGQQKVAIYAFDGSPNLYPIATFTDQAGSARAGVAQLATFKPKDPSSNLNGAVVKALDELDAALGKANQPLKFGTLVVFADGADRANRVPTDEMAHHVREKPFDVFAIGLGTDLKESELREIGKNGIAMAADKNAIVKTFDDVGANVQARTKSFYLLSYCSPSRAGKHEVRIEAVFKEGEGQSEKAGSLQSDFDATGFAPGCDPSTPPNFDLTKTETLAPPPEKEARHEEKKKPKPRPKAPAPPSSAKQQDFNP